MSNVNWADVIEEAKTGGGSFEPIPDGDYDFVVTNATAGQTQNGKPMYTLELTVQGGPSNSRKVWDRLIVSSDNGRAMGFFFRKMKALGLPLEFFQGSPSDDQIVQALRDRAVRAKVGQSTYQGKTGNEIKEYYPAITAPGFAPSAPQAAPAYAAPVPAPQAFAAPPVAAPAAPQYAAPAQAAPLPPAPVQAPGNPWEAAGGQVPPPPPF